MFFTPLTQAALTPHAFENMLRHSQDVLLSAYRGFLRYSLPAEDFQFLLESDIYHADGNSVSSFRIQANISAVRATAGHNLQNDG